MSVQHLALAWAAGWQPVRLVGRGRCSTVYLARPRHGGPWAAIKVARHADLPGGFGSQCALLRALAHPHVLPAFGHGSDGELAFLATAFAARGPLRTGGPHPPGAVAAVAAQAAAALAHLHAHGWVHRDVKPANLLLLGHGDLVLADVGSACRSGTRAPAGTLAGAPRYVAPEQAQGAPAQPAADVYSLGLVLYELLAGRSPFAGETATELHAQHAVAPVPPLPPRHAAWQPLVAAMLAKDPARRPADGGAVFRALAALRLAPCAPQEAS